MTSTTKCPQGHIYDNQIYEVCPYCPRPSDKTTINDDGGETIPMQEAVHDKAPSQHTRIFGGDITDGKKLMGVLITYDLDPLGKVFHLYEGKNVIGSAASSNIHIDSDNLISGKHVTILFRGGLCRFKDEFSTNGTNINGFSKEEGVLGDRDVIQIGSTNLHLMLAPTD
ncbi:MAG: FHA domain-containing protein [Cytophagales bacterium]|nr:FHA domain-containing protein [Cytophagales bacterium]